MSKYLMKSAAAIVLGLAATACSHDLDVMTQEEQQSLDNAQATLGFYIPENQDWKMTSEASINVAIPGDANQTYTVMVFSNNPLEDGIGYYLTKQTMNGGQNLATEIAYPAHLKSLFIGITDSNDVTTYKSASIENGQITALKDIGSAARTRAVDYSLATQTINHPNAPQQPTFRGKNAITEPVMPTIYSNTVPSGTPYAANIGQNDWTNGQTVYIDANYTTLDQNKQELVVYVKDDLTYEGNYSENGTGVKFVVTENKTLVLKTIKQRVSIYLAPGATLDLRQASPVYMNTNASIYLNSGSQVLAGDLQVYDGGKIKNVGGTISATNLIIDKNTTLWNEGTVSVTNELRGYNENAFIYNAAGKTISAKKLSLLNNYDFLYNDGTVTVDEDIELTNTLAEIVNNNTLTAGSLDMSAGGRMYNTTDGTTTIYGTSFLTNNNADGTEWMNDGVYTSGDFIVKNINKVYNNCKLTVTRNDQGGTGTFTLGDKEHCSFVLNGNASVKADNFIWCDDADFYMKDNSLLWVVGTLTSKNEDKGYGLHGLGTGYSILKAANVTYESAFRWRMNYYGNVYVDVEAEHHFPQAFDDGKTTNSDQPHYYFDTTNKTVMFRFLGDPCPIKNEIKEAKCHHGYNPPGPPTPPVEPTVWSYAFEDNRARCDFDMNDVVLRVNINKDDDSKFDVTLVAAGCEYDNYVYLGEDTTPIQWANGSEVHDALGAAKGQMINTGRGVSKTPVTVTISRNGFNPESAPFKIWPYKKDGEFGNTADQKETTPIPVTQLEGSGKAPLGIIVPNKWAWPTERTIITEAYSQFVKWATNAVHVEATDWYNHPTTGKVVNP